MNTTSLFLADQPEEATLPASIVREALPALRRNRAAQLADMPSSEMVDALAKTAARWQRPSDPFRERALREGPDHTGFSGPVLQAGLDAFFASVTTASLEALLMQDFGHMGRLDRFVASEVERHTGRTALAAGPELLAHITSGTLPNPVFLSIIHGLLLRSAQFVKCASGASWLPRLFGHSLRAVDPRLVSSLEIAEWQGGQRPDLEELLFGQADAVTVTGSDQTLQAIRRQWGSQTRLIEYGHRVSFGFITHDALTARRPTALAEAGARDVAMWDQAGCLSPHCFYVEDDGAGGPVCWAEALADALARAATALPRRTLAPQAAAAIRSTREVFELRAAHSDATRVWASPESTEWTVVYERDPLFQLSPLHRFIFVKPVRDVAEVMAGADRVRRHLSTVGLAAPGTRGQEAALRLARWGATRLCPLGRMQCPPLTWRHDGRPGLADWARWTEWEMPEDS